MQRKKLFIFILIPSIIIFLLAAYFLFRKEPISAKLTAQPQTLKAFTPNEKPVKIKSFQEGKIVILTFTYKTTADINVDDTRILLKITGNKINLAAVEGSEGNWPRLNSIETSLFPDTMVFDTSHLIAKKGTERVAVFYGFVRSPQPFEVLAELKSGNNTLARSNVVKVTVK